MDAIEGKSREKWSARLLELLRGDVVWEPEEEVSPALLATEKRIELLAFEINNEVYALNIDDVAEILIPKQITTLPRTPEFILGVLTLRGAVLPVVCLAKRLGQPAGEKKRSSRIIVVRDGDERLGFWVDCVRGVVRFPEDHMETPEFTASVDSVFLQKIGYDVSGNLVIVLSSKGLCDFVLDGK